MAKTQGKVHSIISNLVLVKVEGPVSQNEICFIEENGERLMAEVIKVVGDLAYGSESRTWSVVEKLRWLTE